MTRALRTRNIISILGVTFFLLVSVGCGFHLRGSSELSNQLPELFVQSDNPNAAVITELNRWLRSANISLSESARTTLTISDIKREKRTIAYDSRGKTALYELTLSLSINVTQKSGKTLLEPTVIQARQPYNYNETDTSAKDEEQALLEREMNATMANRIIRHLEKLSFKR